MSLRTWIVGAVAAACVAVLIFRPHMQVQKSPVAGKTTVAKVFQTRHHAAAAISATKRAVSEKRPLKVMAIGGSSAQGYDDPHLDGYLAQALRRVSTALNIPISFVNEAKSGKIPTMLAPEYDPLLQSEKPDIVIISWGLLNDISRKTPESMFQRVIQSEVSMAVKRGVDVWIVTPPVTPATYVGHDVVLEKVYANLEIAGARSVHSAHVQVFDLMNNMKQYLSSHHESYKPYSSNNWHLNHAGHVLAGRILADNILKRATAIGLTP